MTFQSCRLLGVMSCSQMSCVQMLTHNILCFESVAYSSFIHRFHSLVEIITITIHLMNELQFPWVCIGLSPCSSLPNGAIHRTVYSWEGWQPVVPSGVLHWSIHPDLPHMSVPAILMIRQGSDLYHECPDGFPFRVCQADRDPTTRLTEFKQLYFLEVMEVVSSSDRDLVRCVTLIWFEVCVEGHAVDGRFATELDVDKVWLYSIWLPVGIYKGGKRQKCCNIIKVR